MEVSSVPLQWKEGEKERENEVGEQLCYHSDLYRSWYSLYIGCSSTSTGT